MDPDNSLTQNNIPNLGQTFPTTTQETVVGNGTQAAARTASTDKCSYRSCKVKGAVKLKCAASSCGKEIHLMCCQGLLLMKHDLAPLPDGKAVCTKRCYERAMKELSGGHDEDGGRAGKWDSDGKNGPEDTHTSAKILIDWWMEEGNYSRFCGKNNAGVKKIQFANSLAEKMTQETLTHRDGKSVLSKIQHIEKKWREAHNFATSETGAGVKEVDGDTSFNEIVMRKCPYYFDLLDIMQDRASSAPKCTSYASDDEASAVSGVSDISLSTKRTTESKKSTSGKKRKSQSLLMDDSAVAALTTGNKALEQRVLEVARHNQVVEDMEKKRIELEAKREEREAMRLNLEQNKFKSMAWQGKNDELNYKMNLLEKYEEFKRLKWTDDQILRFCPDMSQVISARSSPPLTQPTQDFN